MPGSSLDYVAVLYYERMQLLRRESDLLEIVVGSLPRRPGKPRRKEAHASF